MLEDGLIYQKGSGDKPVHIDSTYLAGLYIFNGSVADIFNDAPIAHDQVVSDNKETLLPFTLT
jgi:hypothetical protein